MTHEESAQNESVTSANAGQSDSLQSRSPAIPSPNAIAVLSQDQRSRRAPLRNMGSLHDARFEEPDLISLAHDTTFEEPVVSAGSRQLNHSLGWSPRSKSEEEEVGKSRGRLKLSRSHTLEPSTENDPPVDSHSSPVLPLPPASNANVSPILSPIEDVSGLPAIRETTITRKNTRRERAVSSVLDFDDGTDLQGTLGHVPLKDRTMSEPRRPAAASRTQSAPMFKRKASSTRTPAPAIPSSKDSQARRQLKDLPASQNLNRLTSAIESSKSEQPLASPIPELMPIPPLSIPTFLHLELSSSRPSPLYIYRPSTTEHPFEPTSAKAERLLNFLVLPPQLERVLWFGTLACMDAWLYNFTILPLRFSFALLKLLRSLMNNTWSELQFLVEFLPLGLLRLWQRLIQGNLDLSSVSIDSETPHSRSLQDQAWRFSFSRPTGKSPRIQSKAGKHKRHRRSRSVASSLVSAEKSAILQGLLIISSTLILMRFDASMMYHSIRGQAAIKLYVIYNALEVFDRLLSAIGQDILECLFSPESLSRRADGRSKILRPLSLFPIALVYVLIHATALYYQVITLNVAVNSYSNALLTLLMSNQFVEIKSTVFKRIEKENLFQMTCADVVERFQLWLMLIIIASRNVIETSTASVPAPATTTSPPAPTLLPFSFTMFPSLSFSRILNPFILVLGTETVVDWIKHAYITKFNNVKPDLYGRFLDVLAKDYYGHAFTDPGLMKRIGLPVIPLTCLAIRAAVQTYHMFREHLLPAPLASNVTTDFSSSSAISPTTAAALRHVDSLFLRVVGDANAVSHGAYTGSDWLEVLPSQIVARYCPTWLWKALTAIPFPTAESLTSWASTLVVLALFYLVLLALKIVLGMLLLNYARNRYVGMKSREQESNFQDGRRNGGWGITELDEDKRRWIYADDPDKAKKLRERDRETKEREMGSTNGNKKDGSKGSKYDSVWRYKLGSSKRIW